MIHILLDGKIALSNSILEKDLSKQEKISPIPKIDAEAATILKPKKKKKS